MAIPLAIPNGGYTYQFVDSPHDRYVCKICIHPCRDPHLSTCCGHNFCKSCLNDVKRTTRVCPCCRDKKFFTVINKQVDREIRELSVVCTNKERGCGWQGELNDIINHLGNSDGCQFEDVKCSNECGMVLLRQYLTNHVETECLCRKVDCQYCLITAEYQFIKGEHKELCPKLPLPCPNRCQVQNIFREDMEAHRKVCPLEDVQCLNMCGKTLKRQSVICHMEVECPCRKVDCQYCHITGEHQFIEGKHVECCPKFPMPCPNKCEIESVPCEDMEAHRKECPLEVVYCEYHSLGCKEVMLRKDLENHENQHMKQHLSLTKSEFADTNREMVNIQQKLTDTQQQLSTIKDELTDTKTQLSDALNQIKRLMILTHQNTDVKRPLYATNAGSGTSGARWSALLAMATVKTPGGQICPVITKVPEFNKKMKNQVSGYTKPFYSHDKGYNMCLRIDAGGHDDGKGSHLSLYLYLKKGPYDDELTWPLRGKFEFKLLNQISDCEHHTKSFTYDDDDDDDDITYRVIDDERAASGLGYLKFISNEDLCMVTHTCQYLKDDCIFLQVSKL